MGRGLDRLGLTIATVGPAGGVPWAPGTVGTATAVPIAYLAAPLGLVPYLALCAAITGLGIWAADRADRVLGTHDSSRIVIDEVAGYLVTMALVDRADPLLLALGFVLFRVADVVKPPPARWFDRGVRGGVGVVLDDVVAGVYAALLLAGMALMDLPGHLRALR
jgi:phosphatidylglycerophosphatase A